MNRRGLLTAVSSLGLTLALSACATNVVEYRYRLTIEFDTPEGMKSASSVIRTTRSYSWPDPFQTVSWKLQGDAVFVDLGSGKHAIALLKHDGALPSSGQSMRSLWVRAYGYPFLDEGVWSGKIKVSGVRELALELVPTIITFADITDPASAVVLLAANYRPECSKELQMMPACSTKDIPMTTDRSSEVLGQGFAFRRATLELVPNNTPVTRGIEKKLPIIMDKLKALKLGTMSERMNAPFWVRSGYFSVK